MAGVPKVKITFDADLDELKKGVKSATGEVSSFSDRVTDFGKKAALAFAAAGAAAGAYASKAIKNALDDEAAQRKLAETLRASTAATDAQIASVGAWIDKTSLAIGVTDDQLRPAFSRLARSTNDVEEAQKLLNLSLDIAAATGKPLETVANALGKAYDGNAASLGRLGLGLDANLLKSKDTNAIMEQLTRTFGNFAENEAETTAKKFERVKIAVDEAQESIGAALLPVVERLATYLLNVVVPNINLFVAGLTGQDGFVDGIDQSAKAAFEWGERIRGLINTIVAFKEELILLGGVIATVFVVSKIAAGVTATIAAVKSLIAVYNALKASAIVAGVASAFALNPLLGVAAVAIGAAVLAGANALANRDGGDTGGGGGSNPIQSGTYLGGSSGGSGGGSIGGGFSAGGGLMGAGGGGGGGGSSLSPTGATNVKNLVDRLTNISEKFSDLQFLVDTGGISRSAGLKQLDALTKEFRVLENQANALTAPTSQFDVGSFRRGEAATMVTINMGVVGDPEGAARAVEQVFQDSLARGGISSTVGAYDR
jgi:hypothetical protein